MLPIINIGGLSVSGYKMGLVGVLIGIGFAALVWRKCMRDILPARHFVNSILITCIAGGLGSRLLGALVLLAHSSRPSGMAAVQYLAYLLSSRVFYGAPICITLCLLAYDRCFHLPSDANLPLSLTSLALFHVFGRVGCLFAGCCYGVPCEHGFVMKDGVTRFPVQLAESLFCLALFFTLFDIGWRRNRRDLVPPLYFLLYGTARFALEFLRGDSIRGIWYGLSTSQWIALATAIPAALCLFGRRLRLRRLRL